MSGLDDLIRELRRRKVVRVAIAYAAAAFVVLQVADIVLPALRLPESAMTLVVVLVALGFPIAVGLAWAFEADRFGIRRTPALPGRRSSVLVPVAAASVLVTALAAGSILLRDDGAEDSELDPGLVAVIPFRVSADAAVEYLREGMVDLMAATLTGESGPRAADPRTAMSAWRRVVESEDQDLTPDQAMRVARIIGAGNVLLGSVVGSTSRITVSAHFVALPSGREGREARAEGPADSVSALVDRVTAQLLSLEAGDVQDRLAGFTSTSLPAVRAYLRGQSLFRQAHFADAKRAFDEALQIDSTFALAALGLRLSSGWDRTTVPFAGRAAGLARRYRDRLAPPDRAVLDALDGTGGPARTVRQRLDDWKRTVSRYPDRPEAWFQYGDELVHRGMVADEPDVPGQARAAFDRALQLDSSFTPALIHLMDNVFFDNDLHEFRRLHAILARADASREVAEYQYWSRVMLLGDSTEIRALRASTDTATTDFLLWMSAFPVLGLGATTDIELAVRTLVSRTVADRRVEDLDTWRAAHDGLINLGQPAAAQALLERALEGARNPMAWLVHAVDDALFSSGDSTFADHAADRIAQLLSDRPSSSSLGYCAVGRWHAWAGRPVDADAARLETLQSQPGYLCAELVRAIRAVVTGAPDARARLDRLDSELSVGPWINTVPLLRINMSVARLFEAMGDHAGALRAIRRRATSAETHMWLVDALELEGRAAAATGDHETAARLLARWLELRTLAEPSLQPKIDRVREELARLTGESSR